jgi:alginate O-acetyltransferase complex protein AlgJ
MQPLLDDMAAQHKKADAAANQTIVGRDGFLFFAPELRHQISGPFWGEAAVAVSKASKPEWADPTGAILDFKAQLDKAGIELIFVPVPAKAVVYADKLSDKAPLKDGLPLRADWQHQEFYKLLEAKGVKVLDLADELIAARKADAKEGPIYCVTDTHWSPRACTLAAGLLAKELASRPWLKDARKVDAATETRTIAVSGDLARNLPEDKRPKEELPARVVGVKAAAGLEPIAPDNDSPIILLGDSHTLVFSIGGDMLATGSGLADQLAAELKVAVDLVGVRGSGASPSRINLMRRVQADAGYLGKKKCIIWCMSVREFTEGSGWRNVPIVK